MQDCLYTEFTTLWKNKWGEETAQILANIKVD